MITETEEDIILQKNL